MSTIPLTIAARLAPYRLAAELAGVVLALVGAGAAAYIAYDLGGEHKLNELTKTWSDQQLIQSKHFNDQLLERQTQIEAMQRADRAKDAAYAINLHRIGAERDRALLSLRNRPSRADAAASVPAACQAASASAGATGAKLYREDGEFLVREAARADILRAALERCQGGDVAFEGGRLDH